ncbi:MAG: DUF2149 domain-containing protein [Methanobacterium sp. ERen5]|nr:MAG: DUF2149 domain-containing protein [Methanobacterium sp. ERen5]
MLRKRRLISSEEEVDPMVYAVNMVDCMLVLAVGFLIFTVMSFGMQSVVFSDASPQEKQQIMQAVQQTVQVQQGQELNNTPQTESGQGSGYVQMGTVYKDPTSGKLIMVGG